MEGPTRYRGQLQPERSVEESLINHLSLPPQLPQHQDLGLERIETALLSRCEDSAMCLRDLPGTTSENVWQSVCRSLAAWRSITASGRLDKAVLEIELRRLDHRDFLTLYIREQNAAICIYRSSDEVMFEVFEVSPRSEDVLAAKSALQWDFPGSAVAIPYETFSDNGFLQSLCQFLEQASSESIKDFAAHTHKAGMQIVEDRDTKDPALISSVLMAILDANGRRFAPALLRKRVRDDVLWHNSAVPWRRLPFWLITRVAIQRHLQRRLCNGHKDSDRARVEYKMFICLVLSRLLGDVQDSTSPDRLSHLKVKLCRRLAKLDGEMQTGSTEAVRAYGYYKEHLYERLEQSVLLAGASLQVRWDRFKASETRAILPLPRRAEPEALTLSFQAGSLNYLRHVLNRFRTSQFFPQYNRPQRTTDNEAPESSEILEPYFKLAESELQLRRDYSLLGDASPGRPVIDVAADIRQYIGNIGDLYEFSVEQKSTTLLTVMEMWMRLDIETCEQFPLLRDFHPSFSPDLLDVLHIPERANMERVRKVQAYLKLRIEASISSMTIFENPREGCFAQRFFDEAPEAARLQDLVKLIRERALSDRQAKEIEWAQKTSTFDNLTREIERSTCEYLPDTIQPQIRRYPGPQSHDPDCRKCDMERQRRNMKMRIFEEPLPTDELMAKVAVFELGGYPDFEAYRDVTWFIIVKLGTATLEPSLPPKCSVREYVQLQTFARPLEPSFRLVSTTKSFLNTHYANVSLPVPLSNVLHLNGLKYAYFDENTGSWARRVRRPSFAHLCALRLPSSSALAPLINAISLDKAGPSSYETIASQASCPAGVNLHEYLAIQGLLAGKSRRWITLLTELGSSNINFSTEATAVIVSHLANRCGPSGEDEGGTLGTNHSVFDDARFCESMLQQMECKLEGIASNWREVFAMEIIITITKRTAELSCEHFRNSGTETRDIYDIASSAILMKARNICLDWVRLLREETKKATDSDTAKRYQTYTLWAALLCKRTFMGTIDSNALPALVLCCITLQDHLATSHDLSSSLKSAIVRDTKTMHSLKNEIEAAIERHPDALLTALNTVWPDNEGQDRQIDKWTLSRAKGCVSLTLASTNEHFREQHVVYNYMHGILLVDGMAIGKLPSDHSTSAILTELFGNQSLLTTPSRLRGMQYALCITPEGHQVHVGLIDGMMVIRACKGSKVWELIPRSVFGTQSYFDLPGPLIAECYHWLDLSEGKFLEIRPKQHMWLSREQNWRVTLSSRVCSRMKQHRDVLVDPHARLFHRAARNLEGLEARKHIVVYQRQINWMKASLIVDLPRLQLSFYNKRGALLCPHYHASIDYDQNIGTWHGLRSSLVLVNPDTRKRMVLVPFGNFKVQREGDHVRVEIDGAGSFGTFSVNEVLQRIECAPEPRLVYQKAQLHAYTSFCLPDTLTGMTGTEAALHWLSSGMCQPWSPLGDPQMEILISIARLSPHQEYYPEDLRVMKKEQWDSNMTTSMQHPAFGEVVKKLIDKSEALALFRLQSFDKSTGPGVSVRSLPVLPGYGDRHLNLRSWIRWQSYHRVSYFTDPPCDLTDQLYTSRDKGTALRRRYEDVREIAELLRTGPSALRTERSLAAALSQCPLILGYGKEVDKADRASISDRLGVDMKREWGPLVSLSRKYRYDKYALMFILGPMVYQSDPNMDLGRTITAFALFDELATIKLPQFSRYEHFRINQCPDEKYLTQLAKPARLPPPHDERADIPNLNGKIRRQIEQRRSKHEQKSEEGCEVLARHLLTAWPSPEPKPLGDGDVEEILVDTDKALEAIRPEWKRLFENMVFSKHLDAVQQILARRYTDESTLPPLFLPPEQEPLEPVRRGRIVPLFQDLTSDGASFPASSQLTMEDSTWPSSQVLQSPALSKDYNPWSAAAGNKSVASHSSRALMQAFEWTEHAEVSASVQELASIVEPCITSKSKIKQRYGEDLLHSLQVFQAKSKASNMNFRGHPTFELRDPEAVKRYLKARLRCVASSLSCPGSAEKTKWLQHGLLFPILTPVTLLERLRSTNSSPPPSVKALLIELGITITRVQKQLRLNSLALKGDQARSTEESENVGHVNWNPSRFPDWLLLEIEADILIRPGQVDVAMATISPPSDSNSVLQMNMGQGKTSVVIPMVSVVLANSKSLARVVVPRALLQQNAQLLSSRLGGLLGREICHIPFSRKSPTDAHALRTYVEMHKHMIQHAGILLCLPEHNMSWMLNGIQHLLDGKVSEAQFLIRAWRWMRQVCRDVLDESDHILAVRTQLIYPSGGQTALDGHPHRWLVAELLLSQVQSHLRGLKRSFPRSLEVVWRQGAFPFVFFLRADVEQELLRRLTADVFNGRTEILPLSGLSHDDRVAVKEFISNHKVRPSTLTRVQKLCPDKPHVRQTVYLLRGLLVNRLLLMALKKRWNVQYGLHPAREPIAVPFTAKGVPSDSSEWGHPDVSVLFTCLSFYYQGLSIEHLKQCLQHLLKADDPASVYDSWTSSPSFPDSLRDWTSINLDDEGQLQDVWVSVRYRGVVVNYFLNNFVFPLHAKTFKVKIMSNGWDIPLLPGESAGGHGVGKPLTTGFSGTNDTKVMLPLTIQQQDLQGLSHTNAEVLTYLLHQRNRGYMVMASREGTRLGEERFLQLLNTHKIRVLIDAGAQILEMDNLTLVNKWLEVDTRAPAALYFDASGKPWILARRSMARTPLLASQYADQLEECLIYLDEAHTRGTDLKLPPNARGALTLGPGQTKDHTVQAAMRLRQLGTTQSVVFFAPPEVHQGILDSQHKQHGDHVDSRDVVSWLLDNTCESIEALQPLYYSQGVDFCRRMQAAVDFPDFLRDADQRKSYVQSILQEEQQTLEQLYGPKTAKSKAATLKKASDPLVSQYLKELEARRKGFVDTGVAVAASALQEVEQEREVEMEVETVRQVKKAVHFPAHNWPGLHRDLAVFARTGRLPAQSLCCSSFMSVLSRTGTGRKFGVSPDALESNLLVSVEFERTVKRMTEKLNDNFMRPVNWILWSDVSSTAIVVIPEEAECLLPIIRQADPKKTYLITYAAPVTRRMLHFQNLDYYTIPTLRASWKAPQWLKAELGLFAGRLYFEWDEYAYLADMYGISEDVAAADRSEEQVQAPATETDGANEHQEVNQEEVKPPSRKLFASRPLNFMQEWLAVRRRGQDFSHTPLGFIASGKPLFADLPFFRQEESEERATLRTVTGRIVADKKEVEEVAYEGGIDVPVSDMDSSSDAESVEYHDDELYSNEEEGEECESPELPSSGDDARRARQRGNRARNGGRRR